MEISDVEKMQANKDVEGLIKALEDSDVRSSAAKALGEIKDARAVEPLIEALKDKDGGVRISAAGALGEIGDERAVEPLIEALKDKDGGVRISAAGALGEIGDERAVEPLIEALMGKVSLAHWRQLWTHHGGGTPQEPEPLTRAFKDDYWDVRSKAAAAEALGEIGDKRAVGPLSSALKYGGIDVGEVARAALEKIRAKKSWWNR